MTWKFPLYQWSGTIPTNDHPGSFAAIRRFDIHTGVDLYVSEPCLVYAVESGMVVGVEDFTGPNADSPWWLPTKAILVEGPSGVVAYGEVAPLWPKVGDFVDQGEMIARVSPVLPEEKQRTDIPNHSRFMLHFELYDHGTKKTVWWKLNEPAPDNLRDPTELLQMALLEK